MLVPFTLINQVLLCCAGKGRFSVAGLQPPPDYIAAAVLCSMRWENDKASRSNIVRGERWVGAGFYSGTRVGCLLGPLVIFYDVLRVTLVGEICCGAQRRTVNGNLRTPATRNGARVKGRKLSNIIKMQRASLKTHTHARTHWCAEWTFERSTSCNLLARPDKIDIFDNRKPLPMPWTLLREQNLKYTHSWRKTLNAVLVLTR